MKMRKYILLVSALSLLLTGCNKEGSAEEWTAEDEALVTQYDIAAQMISQLSGEDVTIDDIMELGDRKWEPQYGKVYDENNPYQRSVLVEGAEEAEVFFCGLGGWREDILQETADGYTIDFTSIGLGKMTFFRAPDGPNVGHATVEIPCMPHLQRVDYVTEEQVGVNETREYPSPAEYGDVFLRQGRYYICVKEATGWQYEESGILVCVEEGKGTNWELYLSKEEWGCWKPKQDWTNPRYLLYFLKLCKDPTFTQAKQQIIKAFPGKVFPRVQLWTSLDDQQTLGDLTWGFGSLTKGYSHVTRDYSNLDSEPSHSDKSTSNWSNRRVIIARDATEGDYKWKKARWERRFHYYVMPWVCNNNTSKGSYKGVYAETKCYTDKDGWKNFFKNKKTIVYTMNAVSFYDKLPSDYVRMPYDEDEDED